MKPRLSSDRILTAPLREIAASAIRNLGLTADPVTLTPEHWQRIPSAVEVRARMRGVDLPAGWRNDLAREMGRDRNDLGALDAYSGTET